MFLYPHENIHCHAAVQQYRECLSDERTFQSWTLENVVQVVKQHTDASWIAEVDDRYLNFETIRV